MEAEAIPQQKKGASFDIRESAMLSDRENAVLKYAEVKNRFLRISHWGEFAGEAPETFVLTDAQGNELDRAARDGDLIKIHLPGPRSRIGGGEDWVLIEKIYEERNKRLDEVFTAMTVRPNRTRKLKIRRLPISLANAPPIPLSSAGIGRRSFAVSMGGTNRSIPIPIGLI
jgi:hypothetical protein